jgi:hypothetical protein
MDVPENGRALFVERRRSLTRLIVQPVAVGVETTQEDGDPTKRLMRSVRLMPKKIPSVRLAGGGGGLKSPIPSALGTKSAFPIFG